MTSIRKEVRVIPTDTVNMKRMLQKYYEQFCKHKFDNLYEMDQFLEKKKKKKQSITIYLYGIENLNN